ncbi:predicted protein, partial [Nematostella vectensis]
GRIYQTEYEVNDNSIFARGLHDYDAPCAACYVPKRTANIMIPATTACPSGWTREYWGYLMTSHYAQAHEYEYICVDTNAQAFPGSHANHNGALLYPVQVSCSGPQCKYYQGDKELTCVVCTK